MKNESRTYEIAYTNRVFVVEPDPAMIGKRGAVYGWRVREGEDEIYSSHDRVPCLAFCEGFERGVIEGRYGWIALKRQS